MVRNKSWRSWAGLIGLAVGCCLIIPEASAKEADPVRYRRPTTKVRTETNLNTKVEAEKKRVKKNQPPAPRLDGAALARQRVAVEQEIARVQIQKLEQLIKLTKSSASDYPDLLFRLADLQLSIKAYHEMQAGELEQSIFEAGEKGKTSLASSLRAKQKRHRKSARMRSQRAVKAYEVLLDSPSGQKYKRRDEALYYAGFEHGLLGHDEQMRDAYLSLIQDFPTSAFTPNALIAFGDQRFAAGKVEEAAKLYRRILEAYEDSPMYAYAHYKLAWCHLNPGDDGAPSYDRSLQSFVAAISATLQGKAGSEENGRLLRRDARRDLVRAYVHAGRPSAAWSFFERVGTGPKGEPPMARKMMELLAGAYFGEGMYVESSAVYQTLISEFSDDPMTCEWQYRVVVNAVATDDSDIVWKETDRLASRWADAKDGGWAKSEKKRCRDHASATLRQMATVWHDEADKTGRDETYARSQLAYERYVESFGERKAAYGISYFYAELLWQQGERLVARSSKDDQASGRAKFRKARDAFVQVLERKPKGKYAKEAAYAQMLAMKNYLEYDELAAKSIACRVQSDGTCPPARRRGQAADKGHAKTPLSDDEVAMLEAYDLYAKYVQAKNDPELPKILYHRTRILVDHNHFEEALPHLQRLVVDFDGTRSAAWGAAMLLDVLTIEWSERATEPDDRIAAGKQLHRWAEKIAKLEVYDSPEAKRLREQVPKVLAAVGWVEAEQLREKGVASGDDEHFVACGRKYLDLFNDYPEHDRADALLFNAARCLEAGHLVGNAIKARRRLLEDYPDSEFAKQTLKEVGQNYQRVAFYDSAAEHFERYADRYSKDEFASEALQNAFLFRLGLGDDAAATENLRKYEQLYRRKDPARAAGIYWAQYDLIDDEMAQARHAEGYVSNYGKKGGADRLVVAHAAAGRALWRQSCSKSLVAESCITIRRKRAQAGDGPRDRAEKLRRRGVPQRCGSEKRAVIVVHARDAKLAARAQAHFAKAIKLSKKVGSLDDDARRVAFEDASAMARVLAADETYEEYLQVRMPTDLDFGTEHEWKKGTGVPRLERQYAAAMKRKASSKARLDAFFESKDRLGAKLLAAYGDVPKATKSKYWTLAAAARSAVLNQNFADQFYRAPVPKNIKNESMYDAYCDQISLLAEVPEKRAKQAFTYCLERSTEFQYFNEFSRMCEDEMQQRDADSYPATNELFGESEYTQSRLDRVGVQTAADKR